MNSVEDHFVGASYSLYNGAGFKCCDLSDECGRVHATVKLSVISILMKRNSCVLVWQFGDSEWHSRSGKWTEQTEEVPRPNPVELQWEMKFERKMMCPLWHKMNVRTSMNESRKTHSWKVKSMLGVYGVKLALSRISNAAGKSRAARIEILPWSMESKISLVSFNSAVEWNFR